MSTTTPSNSDESPHSYSGLENADTNHATWFDPREIDDDEDFLSSTDWRKTHKRSQFKHLDIQHRGYGNGVRRNKRFDTFQGNLHLSQALSGTLGLTSRQRTNAEMWFRRLDFQRLGYSLNLSGYCTCARIVHEDDRDGRTCHPSTLIDDWPSEFRMMYEAFSKEEARLVPKVYGTIDYRIRHWTIGDDEPASERMDRYGWQQGHPYHDEDEVFG